MNWKEAVFTLVQDREITGEMYRVLLVLLAEGNGEKPVFFSQAEIGAIIGMKQQNVGRTLSKLTRKGLIKKDVKEGKSCYLLVEHFGINEQTFSSSK